VSSWIANSLILAVALGAFVFLWFLYAPEDDDQEPDERRAELNDARQWDPRHGADG
jgi:hypothetical protein